MSYTVSHAKNMQQNDASITIRCDKEFKRRLAEFAKSKDLTISQLVRRHFRGATPSKSRKRKAA